MDFLDGYAQEREEPHPSVTPSPETVDASSHPPFPHSSPSSRERSLGSVSALASSRNTKQLSIDSSTAPLRHTIRRKPLSPTASPIATRYSSGEYLTIAKDLARPSTRNSRAFSVDSPTIYEYPVASIETVAGWDPPVAPLKIAPPSDIPEEVDDLGISIPSANSKPAAALAPQHQPVQHITDDGPLVEADVDEDRLSLLDGYDGYQSESSYNSNPDNSDMPSIVPPKQTPQLNLDRVDKGPPANPITSPNTGKPLPKSPGSKLGTFFGWGSSPAATEATEFSDQGYFPDASSGTTGKSASPQAQNRSGNNRDYLDPNSPALPPPPPFGIEEMEDELKAISAELASSIRREMDLEDLVDRLQSERDNLGGNNRRTSDYFSDSGYSSSRYTEYDQQKEDAEKLQRKAEQELAQVKLELTSKLQEERARRQQLDDQIKDLSEKAAQFDTMQQSNLDARVKELESTCETLRRKLSEERQVKDNFEDLLSALKGELQNAANERDNLRDEIVPQLRARVEGLETQASAFEKMNYESTKLQQELQNLKAENTNLKQQHSMGSIAEEPGPQSSFRLSRSNSLAGNRSSRSFSKGPGLSRSKSVRTNTESREQLAERLKDVEEQRDALHRALKALLTRQEHQDSENEKKLRALEMERDRLMSGSPQKAGYVKEISNLRDEINTLRHRAEDALEQKWQMEKGLAGLKMDLDRAEQEIAYLKSLLQEKDMLADDANDSSDDPVTSGSLAAAYSDLQKAYAESLDRVKKLELSAGPGDEKTKLALERLEQVLAATVSERDLARQDASSYKEQLAALRAGEREWMESEKALADELRESARRVEELAIEVRQQLASNQKLRQRLSDTVARGQADQKSNAEHITAMEARLRTLEDQLVAAQTASEERVARHEEEISSLKESHNQQLARLSNSHLSASRLSGMRTPRVFPAKSPLSPLFSNTGARSPRLDMTREGPAMSLAEETQVETLKSRVSELEKALAETDIEMEQVVSRMNTAQIEVMQLQEERDAAVNSTRKLERQLQAERLKAIEAFGQR